MTVRGDKDIEINYLHYNGEVKHFFSYNALINKYNIHVHNIMYSYYYSNKYFKYLNFIYLAIYVLFRFSTE